MEYPKILSSCKFYENQQQGGEQMLLMLPLLKGGKNEASINFLWQQPG